MAQHRVSDETPLFTYAMAAAFLAVFAAQATNSDLTPLMEYAWRLGRGELWRLLTSTLIHGSILHFVFNIAMFVHFGTAIERWLGPWVAMLMYVLFAAVSGAAEALWSPGAIGASGAVYGMFGFLWVTRRRYDAAAEAVTPYIIQIALGWLVIGFIVGLFGVPLGNVAHLFGLISGWLLGQAVIATRRVRPLLIVASAALSVLLLAMLWEPVYRRSIGQIPGLTRRYGAEVDVPESEWPAKEHEGAAPNPLKKVL